MTVVVVLSWLVLGFIVSALARAFFPGLQRVGFLSTTALGVVGSVAGGLLSNAIVGAPVFTCRAAGAVGSVLGALLVLSWAVFSTRRSPIARIRGHG